MGPEQKEAGWREYGTAKDPELRQQLILENVRLVYYAYGRMKGPASAGNGAGGRDRLRDYGTD